MKSQPRLTTDSSPARYVSYGKLMAVAMTVYTLALVAFPFATNLVHVYAYGVAMGICGGIVTVVFFGVWSHAYGRDHLGQIQGIAQAATGRGVRVGACGVCRVFEVDGFVRSCILDPRPLRGLPGSGGMDHTHTAC